MRQFFLQVLIIPLVMLSSVCALAQPAPPRGEIALSFDDAPRGNGPYFTGEERGAALIKALEDVDVTGAMFFVTTQKIDIEKDGTQRLKNYVAAGHHLANHSHTHPWLRRTESADYIADIDQATSILSGMDGWQPFFRYPYLDEGRPQARRDDVRRALNERGLTNGYVTIDNYDWYMAALVAEARRSGHDIDLDVLRETYVDVLLSAVEFYDGIAVEALGRSPRHVILLHENDIAALFIDDLVRALRAEGWKIIPAVEAYQDPIAEQTPDTMFLGQGRVAALARETGMAPRDLIHEAEDEAWLRALFEARGLLPTSD
jgi:peptidoglycan/xylan/chitin deacetylase (PgdA/CDA1 family)